MVTFTLKTLPKKKIFIFFFGNSNIKGLEDWSCTNDKRANNPEIDYCFNGFDIDLQSIEDSNFTKEVESKFGIQFIAGIQNGKVIYGNNVNKIRHKARIEVNKYTSCSEKYRKYQCKICS